MTRRRMRRMTNRLSEAIAFFLSLNYYASYTPQSNIKWDFIIFADYRS